MRAASARASACSFRDSARSFARRLPEFSRYPASLAVFSNDGERYLAEYGQRAHVMGHIDVSAQWTPIAVDADNNEWALRSHDGRYLTINAEPGGHGVSLVIGAGANTTWTFGASG